MSNEEPHSNGTATVTPTTSIVEGNSSRRPHKKPIQKGKKGRANGPKTQNTPSKPAEPSDSKEPASQPSPSRRNKNPRFNKNRVQGQLTVDAPDDDKKHSDKAKHRSKKLPVPDLNDLCSTLSHDLKTSAYECMVCWDVVRTAQRTWNCDCCWAIFHLNCIQKWATKSLQDKTANKPITSWRCPGCQNNRTAIPADYFCFCGKQQNPDVNRYTTPHSCGQLCKKIRQCPHNCVLPCHPGPCPPCTAMGPVRTCYCSLNKKQSRCSDTDYTTQGYVCDTECGAALGCGKHRCKEKCHPGLCDPCILEESQSCYCGQQTRVGRCSSGEPVQLETHVGRYSCQQSCNKSFECGNHRCEKACHPCKAPNTRCPFDVETVKFCPCGALPISDLLGGSNRTSCTDPIPTCSSVCNKLLPCGHHCKKKCHTGDCSKCEEIVEVSCRCLSTKMERVCADVCEAAGGEVTLCDKICKSRRNCGRHQCGKTCCPAKRQQNMQSSGAGFAEKPIHDCELECGRTLSCGVHKCDRKCHRHNCNTCMEAVFDPVTCNCGRTRLEPPVRCGTKLPPCEHPCIRPAPCGHYRFLQHQCHPDNEPCPPCATLVSKQCVCGKVELKNIQCYRENPQCGQICGKTLSCGKHKCLKTCHAGPCLSTEETCLQPCDSVRSCGHRCLSKCHADSPCPENEPCPDIVRSVCKCGQHSLELRCNATFNSSGSKQELECNDFCAKVNRMRRFAEALDISSENRGSETMPSSDELGYYDDSLRQFYLENRRWCDQMEAALSDFAKGDKTTMYCKPMRSAFRRFIHRYCIHFNVTTEAVDPEPKRSVIIRKTLGKCRIPSILLSKAARNPSAYEKIQATALQSLQGKEEASTSRVPKAAVNGIYLSDVEFGLTKEDLDRALLPLIGNVNVISRWVSDSDVILTLDDTSCIEEKERFLWSFKRQAKSTGLAMRVDCCWVNQEGKVTWTEKRTAEQEVNRVSTPVLKNTFEALANTEDDGWIQVTPNTPRGEESKEEIAGHPDSASNSSRASVEPHVNTKCDLEPSQQPILSRVD